MSATAGTVEVPTGLSAAADAGPARRVWSVVWRSRLLVWLVGSGAALTLKPGVAGAGPVLGIAKSFGHIGNVLAAPAVRWDGAWYLYIAKHGYATLASTRFFPLDPLLIRAATLLWIPPVIAGVAISVVSMFVALTIIHRLAALELGEGIANLSIDLIAFSPVALYFSSVYSESLLMALTAASIYSARRGRWALAGATGALASLARVTGFLVFVPVAIIFLYGPRTDKPPEHTGKGWLPRYRFSRALLWTFLIPAGTVIYGCFLKLNGYGYLAFMHAQTQLLHHVLLPPVITVWQAASDGWHRLTLGISGLGGGLSPRDQSVVGLFALIAALVALRAVWRRLPFCYTAFIVAGLLIPLSSPTVGDPLKGLARYEAVLFPLYIGAAAWARQRGMRRPLMIASALLLALFTAQFATWHVVGSQTL